MALDMKMSGGIRQGDRKILDVDSQTTASEMWRLRREVRQTTSLLSTHGHVKEMPADCWAAAWKERIIYWRPVHSWPPYDAITHDQLLFNIGHEAGHLNFTGDYHIPDGWTNHKKQAQHFAMNAVEDIRIERLMGQEFPGLETMRIPDNSDVLKFHRDCDPTGYSVMDAVMLSYMALEIGEEPFGVPAAIEFSKRTWPTVSKVCNANDTATLVERIRPIFEELYKAEDEGRAPDAGNVDLDAAGAGMGDSPSKHPSRSQGNSGKAGPMNSQQIIEHLAKEAIDGATIQKLEAALIKDDAAKQKGNATAKKLGAQAGGEEAGKGSGRHVSDDSWDRTKDALRPEIIALTRRFKATLRTNAAGAWTTGLKRGHLHTGRAHVAAAGNNRIFRKRTSVGDIDYTFGIVVDRSGSMKGTKAQGALKACVLVCEAAQAAGLGNFVVTFDDGPAQVKGIRQSIDARKGDVGGSILHSTGGTYEAPALLIALEEFRKVPSGHRLLITITDGKTNGVPESKEIIAEMHRLGVTCVSVAIGFEPGAHYDVQLKVPSADALSRELPRLVNATMKKGHV